MKLIVNEKQYNKLLKESRGFSQSAEDWAYIITDEVMKYIFKIDGEEPLLMTKLTLKYGDKEFFKKLPIESIIVNVIMERVDGDDGNMDAAYMPYSSHIEDGVIEDVELEMEITLPKTADAENSYEIVSKHMFQVLSHELLHVFEWFNRGLENPTERKSCVALYMDGDLHGNAVERIAYMLYTQLSFEMNAFVHQAGTMLRLRDIKTYDDFIDELHNLVIWDFVQAMLDYNVDEVLKELEKLSDEDKELFNNIKICYYASENKEDGLKIDPKSIGYSDERFLKDLGQRFKVRGEAMKRKLYRLATDLL